MSDQILDFNDFMERVQNDKELFFELLDIFVADYYVKRKQLGEAIANKDYKTIEYVGHFLKGSCGNISSAPLRIIFSDLEQQGKANKLTDGDQYLADIDQKFEELIQFIGKLRLRL